ncbi:MAG: response regulator [Pseudomonadota bacterium]
MKPLGIKVKVALATSATSIVMIGLVTAVQLQRLRDDFTKVLFTQQTALINRTAEELDDKLSTLIEIIDLTAKKTPPELLSRPDQLRRYYDSHAVLTLFDDVLVLDARGKVVADLPAVPGRVGIDSSDRQYFKTVSRTLQPMIAEPVFGKVSKKPVVQVAAPLLNAQGELVGLVVGVLQLYKDNVLGHLRTAKVGRTGYYFAVTRSAVPIYVLHPDASRLLKPRPPNANPATTRALSGEFEGSTISTNSTGLRALNSFKKLKSANWLLGASLPVQEAFEPFDGLLYRLAAWSFLASLAAAALIGWLTVRLLSPLVRLRDAIFQLRGDASRFTPIPVAHRDEIGELTMAFNGLMHERLAADARLQGLIEFAPNAMLVIDADGRIETFNRQAERNFGHAREQVAGQPVEMLMPARYRQPHQGQRQHFFATRLSAEPRAMGRGQVLWGLRQDGSEFPLEVSLSAIRTDQGTKVLAVIADITDRYHLQLELEARAAELEEQRDRADAANHAKSDFVANMSHEIRTPLNAVLGMVYLLGTTSLTGEQRKYLTMVRVSGQSLLGILNDVLDFSKIEARRMELAPVEFDLDELINNLATTMTMNAGEKELELVIAVDSAVPRRLWGDALRLQQILVNLAGNAIKFTGAGEVVVRVALDGPGPETETAPVTVTVTETEPETEPGARRTWLRFEVSDTGIGMSQAQQSQLFQAFSQADQSITRRFGGTGLGLAITKHLIHMMGGEIAVHSAEGTGSRFWFSLPFKVLPSPAGKRREPDIGPLRLLVVDDHRTSRALITELINAWGWDADQADSGPAALALFNQRQGMRQPYDVVLADWHMPAMDGLATAKAIRLASAGEKQPIVVMINAFARDRLEEISSAAEADVVLMKPITGSSLFDAVHQALTFKDNVKETLMANHSIAGSLLGLHFLLVEDNLLNQAVARGILEHAGATLDVAGDGQQAVERLRIEARRYDIVLMDMQMPVLDGFSATHLIRTELRLTLPVIAMTAGVLASERERCVTAGISDFIAKPVVVEEMMQVLRKHIPTVPAGRRQGQERDDTTGADGTDLTVFSMEKLMHVMGGDPKGLGVLVRIVREALAGGDTPVALAETALGEGRPRDAARILHGLRGSVGVMGTKRLIEAVLRAEQAIEEDRQGELKGLMATVRAELALALEHARVWLHQVAGTPP